MKISSGKTRRGMSFLVIQLIAWSLCSAAFGKDPLSFQAAESTYIQAMAVVLDNHEIDIVNAAIRLTRPDVADLLGIPVADKAFTERGVEICGTPMLLEAREILATIEEAVPGASDLLIAEDAQLDAVELFTHFNINYTLDINDPDHLSDKSWATKIGNFLESSYGIEVDDWGYDNWFAATTPGTKFEIDLVYRAPDANGSYTAGWVNSGDPSRININTYMENGSGIDDTGIFDTCAHEFYHTCQFRYRIPNNFGDVRSILEGSAAWVGYAAYREHYPNGSQADHSRIFFKARIDTFFEYVNLSWDDERGHDGYPTGAFFHFLADNTRKNFSGGGASRDVIRSFWEGYRNSDDVEDVIEEAFDGAGQGLDSFSAAYDFFIESAARWDSWYPAFLWSPTLTIPEITTVGAGSSITVDSESSDTDDWSAVEHFGAQYFEVEVNPDNDINIEFIGDSSSRLFYKIYPDIVVKIFPDYDPDNPIVLIPNDGRVSTTIHAETAMVAVMRHDDGDLLGSPSGNYQVVMREIPHVPVAQSMDFEQGTDANVIRSTIPGMVFSTTQGYDWIYGDKSTGKYAVNPYGDYVCNGNFFAWLGPNQGAGRIDFTGHTARSVSMMTSTYSGLYLDAYNDAGQKIDSDHIGSNFGTGLMSMLSVSGDNISYVLVHDSGNYWLIDDLVVEDLLRLATGLLGQEFSPVFQVLDLIDQDETQVFSFNNESVTDLELVLDWAGSELGLRATSPDGDIVEEWRSQSPPMVISLDNAAAGTWTFDVTAYDVPNADYPFAFVVGATEPPEDDTPPLVMINSPIEGMQYSDSVPIFFEFLAEDPETDIASVQAVLDGTQTVENGQSMIVEAGTSHIFTVTATNGAGLITTSSVEFSVLDFEWLDPLAELGDDSPFFSKANRTIPVKFTLNDGYGDFVVSDDVRVVLENTDADFTLCDGTESTDSCIRIDFEDETVKYIVNFHTNPKREDYGIVRGDSYSLNVLVDGRVIASREIVFPSFPVATSSATGFLVPGETQVIEWNPPEGTYFLGSTIYFTSNGGSTWDEVGLVDGGQNTFEFTVPDHVVTEALVMVVSKSTAGILHGVSGEFSVGVVSDVPDESLQAIFALGQNIPNPFNPSTSINFSLAQSGRVDLKIFDLSGRKVRTLVSGQVLDSGLHKKVWNGTDDAGGRVAAGVYFYRLETGDFRETKRMTLIK